MCLCPNWYQNGFQIIFTFFFQLNWHTFVQSMECLKTQIRSWIFTTVYCPWFTKLLSSYFTSFVLEEWVDSELIYFLAHTLRLYCFYRLSFADLAWVKLISFIISITVIRSLIGNSTLRPFVNVAPQLTAARTTAAATAGWRAHSQRCRWSPLGHGTRSGDRPWGLNERRRSLVEFSTGRRFGNVDSPAPRSSMDSMRFGRR